MKTLILFLIAMISGTTALADNSYIPIVKCNGGEFVIDEIRVPHHGSFMRYFQFIVRNDAINQDLVDRGAASHSFRGEVIIGGAGSNSTQLGNGTRFIANRVYDRSGTSRMVTYYAYPTSSSTVSLDIYEATQTGPSSFRNDRLIAQLHFDHCQM